MKKYIAFAGEFFLRHINNACLKYAGSAREKYHGA
jgi:hypothetical protein